MRINNRPERPEPDDNDHDLNNEKWEDPRELADVIGDEFTDYLNAVLAEGSPPDDDIVRPPAKDLSPAAAGTPALRLVKDEGSVPAEKTVSEEATDPHAAASAARKRLIRGSAKGSAVVAGLGLVAGWGEPLVVVGPLAVYGAGWLAYLWWNAALRPPIPQAIGSTSHALTGGIAAAASATSRTVRRAVKRAENDPRVPDASRTHPA
ncbi:hypothetical protein [Nocardia carnea]|uniref:hypothetical protein n=1 Tax=Nocardia carnea TaxID=37328 RepID=UPI002457E5A6|nr:hypothetical protein [Nocardia carnea]